MSETKNLPIVTSGISRFLAAPTSEAESAKWALIEAAGMVLQVSSEEEQTQAVEMASSIKAMEKEIEQTREAIKAPILEAGRTVDAACRKFVAELTGERCRIEGLVTGFALEQRRQREAVIQAQREAQRQAELEAEKFQREEAEKRHGEFYEPPVEPPPVTIVQPVPEEKKIKGASLRVNWDYEVTDIHKLYAFNRAFVKVSDDRQFLKAYLNREGVDPRSIPGIRVFETAKTVTKAAAKKAEKQLE